MDSALTSAEQEVVKPYLIELYEQRVLRNVLNDTQTALHLPFF